MSNVGKAMAASYSTKHGDFRKLMEIYPNKVMWADNASRLVLIRGEMGDVVPMSMLYAANFVILYDNEKFIVAKNRTGNVRAIIVLLNDLFQIESFQVKDNILYVSDKEDLTIMKLKGIL